MPRLNKLTTLLGTAAMAAALVAANPAKAALVTAVGDTFNVFFTLAAGATDKPGGNENVTGQDLTASVNFLVTSFDATLQQLGLQLTITNTTVDAGNDAHLWKLAFGINPDGTIDGFTPGDNFVNATEDPIAAFGFLMVDIETSTQPPGAPTRLEEGEVDVVGLLLGFDESIEDGVDITPFGVFFQTALGSYQFPGTEIPPPNGEEIIPEPASAALLGFGLLGLGYALRRRKLAA